MKKTLSHRERILLEVIRSPRTYVELIKIVGFKKADNLSHILKALLSSEFIYCLNPKARTGKLYGITNKGKRLRKKLGCSEFHQPDDVNWNLYGWIVSGKQRRAILKALCDDCLMSARLIRERAQEYNRHISRINTYDVLQQFVRKKIVKKIKEKCRVYFVLTTVGKKIRQQLLIK